MDAHVVHSAEGDHLDLVVLEDLYRSLRIRVHGQHPTHPQGLDALRITIELQSPMLQLRHETAVTLLDLQAWEGALAGGGEVLVWSEGGLDLDVSLHQAPWGWVVCCYDGPLSGVRVELPVVADGDWLAAQRELAARVREAYPGLVGVG